MSIKYGSHDLVKRIIHLNGVGYNVEKVIYDDNQIWPSSTPPQPTYHIVGDFTQGSLPSGWSSTYGGVSYSNNGISLDTTRGTDYVTIKNQNSMPSLENASRIKIDYDFYRTDFIQFKSQWSGGIKYNNGGSNFLRLESSAAYLGYISPGNDGVHLWAAYSTNGSERISSLELGKYTLSIDADLINKTVTQTLTYPNQSTSQSTGVITNDDVEAIREGNIFYITLYEGITMSDMNMYIWYITPPVSKPWLCFTANTGGSTIELDKTGNPTIVTLETSTDGETWTTYTIGTPITLSNIGDKIYWRNTSEIPTGFSSGLDCYRFYMSGSISASGDINYLLCKNSTTDLTNSRDNVFYELFQGCTSLTTAPQLPATILTGACYFAMFSNCTSLTTAPQLPATTLTGACYSNMFRGCTSLTTAPQLPATTLVGNCYFRMFQDCTSLTTIPQLPATTLATYCYAEMFDRCSSIELSETQTGEYQTPYRIPSSGTGTSGMDSLNGMFSHTGGTFTGTPNINQTYYTSNQVI